MLNEDDILSVVLKSAETRDALRVIVRVAIREATLRAKAGPPVEDVTVIGAMTIDRLRHTITVAGEVRPVKPREFALIETLARRLGFVFSRPTLLELAWTKNADEIDDERTVDVHIRRLRAKLGPAANIRTVPGVGYALDPPKED